MIELLVTVTVAGILLTIALGTLPDLAAGARTRANVSAFVSLIAAARHSAITGGHAVVLCPAAGDQCGRRDSWHRGSVAFTDHNNNLRIDAADRLIGRLPALPDTRVRWRAFRARSFLRFRPQGYTDWQNGHFLFCPTQDTPELARQLVLNHAGRTYVTGDADGDGIHEDRRGRPLRCT